MRANTKEILRWIAISSFGGFGIWMLVSGGYSVITHGTGLGVIFLLTVLLFFVTPFLVAAYLCICRKYRQLYNVLGVVSSIVVLGELWSVQRHWNIERFVDRPLPVLANEQDVLLAVLRFLVGIIWAVGPIYAAVWVYRACNRLAQRPTSVGSDQ